MNRDLDIMKIFILLLMDIVTLKVSPNIEWYGRCGWRCWQCTTKCKQY